MENGAYTLLMMECVNFGLLGNYASSKKDQV